MSTTVRTTVRTNTPVEALSEEDLDALTEVLLEDAEEEFLLPSRKEEHDYTPKEKTPRRRHERKQEEW